MTPALKPRRSPRRPPESEAARARRLHNLAVQLADREHRAKSALANLSGGLPRNRGHVTRLDQIEDDERRLMVWKARVERLEALLDQTERKRETRAKIVLGGALLAEARTDGEGAELMARLLDVLDRRVVRPLDRKALADTLGLPIEALPGGTKPTLPDFDAMARAALMSDEGTAARPGGRRKKGA
uniref:hypothetical protein n=1 Tax=uncultured Caulobacter sp. TaxID=158749 RepID=UPI0025D07C9F|nr:hypothetical protein [uncultured Caulobacter sp.]